MSHAHFGRNFFIFAPVLISNWSTVGVCLFARSLVCVERVRATLFDNVVVQQPVRTYMCIYMLKSLSPPPPPWPLLLLLLNAWIPSTADTEYTFSRFQIHNKHAHTLFIELRSCFHFCDVCIGGKIKCLFLCRVDKGYG